MRHPGHTQRGLRVGDRVRRLRRLYPKAPRSGATYKLITGRNVYGSGRGRYAVVGARVNGGRVRSFVLDVGAAGE